MSYSIDDAISDLEKDVDAAKQIHERFPDAWEQREIQHDRSGTLWVSASLKPEECDHVVIGQHDVVRVGTLVAGRMVAKPIVYGAGCVPPTTIAELLRKLKDGSPELFRALTLFAAGAKVPT